MHAYKWKDEEMTLLDNLASSESLMFCSILDC